MTSGVRAQVRALVYRTLGAEGRAPSIREIARVVGCTPAEAQDALRLLGERHLLVPTPDGDAVRIAHPFSAAPMAFVVTPQDGRDDRRWWGGCAWDSFGISAALNLDVLIDTACPGCGTHLRTTCGPQNPPSATAVVWFPTSAAHWWDDVVTTCTAIRLFCDADHGNDWLNETGEAGGQLVPAVTVWKLAKPWYGDRLAPDYVAHSREHNQALLESVGLTGDFWRLP